MKVHNPGPLQPIPDDAKLAFHGILFDVYQWQQPQFDGSTCTFEKLVRSDTGTVIAVTPDGKIILNREQQPGMREFIGLPGGKVDAGEDALEAVKRELLEETGYEADDWVLWLQSHPSEKINYTSRSYLARNARKVTEPQEAGGEKMTQLFVSFTEYLELVQDDLYRDDEVALGVLRLSNKPAEIAAFKTALGL